KLREAGVLLKAAFEPEKVTNNTTITNALEKMGLNENEAMRLVKNEIVKATDDGNIVSNPEAVLSKMPPAESSKFSKVEGFGPLRTNWDASEVSPDKKAIVSFPIANAFAGFANLLLSDIDIFKLDDDGDVYHFTRAESLDGLKAGHYIITQKDDSTVTIAPTALLKGDELLYIAIEDDSELDYDKTKGKIFDPFNVGARNRVNDDGGGSGSGGGCDTGVGAFALLLAASAALFKSRKK
ncbi:MAG: hypothetical protein LBU13_00910, partial [Synergistaceae bacterium]|nr:hypothetical protein [Synergistaceae bacterium]